MHMTKLSDFRFELVELMCMSYMQIATDKLTKIAHENWSASTSSQSAAKSFSPELVTSIYMEELGGAANRSPSLKRIILLEISQYLESYLWPNLPDTSTGAEPASFEHIMSILIMVNEKFRENVPPWTCFHARKVLCFIVVLIAAVYMSASFLFRFH
jgi:intron-binding protein aquarius